VNYQIAHETVARNGHGGGMCKRPPKANTSETLCMFDILQWACLQ